MVLSSALLFSLFLAIGCKQGNGDRCVQNSDCESGYCSSNGNPQGGTCHSASSTGPIPTGGTGGAGAEGGQGGEGGQAGSAASDAAASDVADASDALPGG